MFLNLNFSVFQAGKSKKKEFKGRDDAKDVVKKTVDDKVVGGAVIERATPTVVPAPPPAPVAAAPFKGVTEDGATVFENNKYFDVPKPNNNIIGTQNNGAIKTEIGKVDNSAGVTPVPGHAAPTFLVGVDAGAKVCICIPLF